MHSVLIILTLIFIQGNTDLTPENDKYSIILETVRAMPIKYAVKIVQTKERIDTILNWTELNWTNVYYNSNILDSI